MKNRRARSGGAAVASLSQPARYSSVPFLMAALVKASAVASESAHTSVNITHMAAASPHYYTAEPPGEDLPFARVGGLKISLALEAGFC